MMISHLQLRSKKEGSSLAGMHAIDKSIQCAYLCVAFEERVIDVGERTLYRIFQWRC